MTLFHVTLTILIIAGIFGDDHMIMNHTIDIEEMPVKKDFVRGVSYLTGNHSNVLASTPHCLTSGFCFWL